MPARDVILTVGNEILEATMSYRCRWFEYLNYRPLIQKYFNEDLNMNTRPLQSLGLQIKIIEKIICLKK